MFIEVPDDDTAPADHGRIIIVAPLPGPYPVVHPEMPVTDVAMPRAELALVLQYAHHVALRNPDPGLQVALSVLSERLAHG